MIRTQIQLTEEQAARLREIASVEERSLADLIRESVELYVGTRGGVGRDELKARAIAAAGRFRSGERDLGSSHDAHLAKVFKD